jgi:hypothetical protein
VSRLPTWFRISLRELLLLVALAALALASIRYASTPWRTVVYTIAMAVFMSAAVVAVIDRGPRQAFAIGMVLTMVIYATLVRNGVAGERGENRELDPRRGRLPTTRAARYIYRSTTSERWFDDQGNELTDFDPTNPPPGVRRVTRRGNTSPSRELFMQVVHCWWALFLGFLGGLFARFVYVRRTSEPLRSAP